MPDDKIESIALPLAAAVATPFIGPELLPASLADDAGATTIADALTGAALGAGASALTGGNPLTGALTGGIGGGLAPNLGDIANAAGLGGEASGTAPITTAPDVTVGSGVTASAPTADVNVGALTPTPTAAAGPSAVAPALGGAAGAGEAPIDFTTIGTASPAGANGIAPISVDTSGLVAPGGSLGGKTPADLGSLTSSAPNAFGSSLPGTPANPFAATSGANIATAPIGTESLPAGTSFAQFANPTAVADANVANGVAPQGTLDSMLSKAGSTVAKNPLGTAVAGGGLLYNLLSNPSLPSSAQPAAVAPKVSAAADQLAQQGGQLQSYLSSGTLPPGAQTALTNASNAAKAAIKSRYASLGLSGSTMEQQDLNNIDLQTQAQGFQMASQLLNEGVSETGLSAELYNQLLGISTQQNQATGNAISNFARALNGGPNQITLKTA